MSLLLHALVAWSALLHGGTAISPANAWSDDVSFTACAELGTSVESPLVPGASRVVPRPASSLERGELEVEPKLESFECAQSTSSATYARADSVPELASIAPREADAPQRRDVSARVRRLRGPPRR